MKKEFDWIPWLIGFLMILLLIYLIKIQYFGK